MSETKKPGFGDIAVCEESRRSRFQFRCIGGHPFTAEIYTALNMRDNAEALDTLIAAGCQSVRCSECGINLSVAQPVAIHDPEKHRFAIYIPDMLSHWELELRASVFEKLIAAGADGLPTYFSDFLTLVGRPALGMWLTSRQSRPKTAHSSAQPQEGVRLSDKAGNPPKERSPSSNKEAPPIHAAFADLDESDSYIPSVPPDVDPEDAEDDWLDDRTLTSGVHAKPLLSEPPAVGREGIVDLESNRVVLIQRARNEIIEAFDSRKSELRIQLHRIEGFPLVVLALVSEPMDESRPFLHWAVDATTQAQNSVLLELQREFLAEVRLYTLDLKEAMRFDMTGPRESNVALIMKRVSEMLAEKPTRAGDFEKAVAAFKKMKDPLGRNLGSFSFDETAAPGDFETAFKNLEKLEEWVVRERFEQLVFIRSFPISKLDEMISRTLKHAISFGINLHDDLKDRAVAMGLASSRKEIISKTMSTFDKLLRSGKGPSEEIAAANWQKVLKDCDDEGIEPDVGARERAGELLGRVGIENPDNPNAAEKA